MPFGSEKFARPEFGGSTKRPKKAKRKTREVAGPYRSQSSKPKIRKEATPREHRRVKVRARRSKQPFEVPDISKPSPRPASEEKALRQLRKGLRKAAPPDPHFEYLRAKRFGEPTSRALKEKYPHVAKEARKARLEYISGHEALEEDPLAEFVISTAATAGLGAGAKALGTAAEKALAASAGEKLAGAGTTAAQEVAEKGAKALLKKTAGKAKAAPAKKLARAKSAPRGAARRVRETPERARMAPKRAKRAATTSEGRREAARTAARHPVRTGVPAVAALPEGALPGDATKRTRAFLEGTGNAIIHHPGETAKTTLRAVPAGLIAVGDLAAAAGASALHGTPKPLEKTASEQFQGVKHIAEQAFSGDPKKAEEAARKEGSLAFLTPLPALSRTRAGKAVVRDVREASSATRRKLATTDKLPAKEFRNRNIRHAPKGTQEHAFGITARHHQRKRTAVRKSRIDNPHRVEIVNHHNAITEAAAKIERKHEGAHVTHQVLAEYGVRTPEQAKFLREHGPGDPQLVKALDWLDRHPEYFKKQAYKPVLDALEYNGRSLPAAKVGKGERARLLQQGDMFGITRPEKSSPIPGHGTRAESWSQALEMDKQVTALRKEGRERFSQAKVLKGAERGAAMREGKALYARARKLRAETRDLIHALSPYTRPDHSIDRSKRMPYDKAMLEEYKRQVERRRKEAGFARAIWTGHIGDRGAGLENPFPAPHGNLEHMREGLHAKEGKLDRSFEGLVRGTVHLPRLKASAKEVGRGLAQEKLPYIWDGKTKYTIPDAGTWTAITSPRTKDNPNGGQYDPKSVGRFAVRELKNAIDDPFMGDAERAGRLDTILAEAESGQVKGHAPSLLLPRELIREARAQITPPQSGILNATARASSHLLLGSNPGWAISQIPAEGFPLIMAKPSLLWKTPTLERDMRRYAERYPDNALSARATAGASPIRAGANLQPRDIQETYTPDLWAKGAKTLTRGRTAKHAISFAKLESLGRFDVRRQNEFRTLLYAAEADKRFRSWHSSLTNLFDSEARLSKRFKTREELWHWLEHDPKGKIEKAKIEDYVDNIQGNWTAFTRHEMKYAPMVLFYPFLRYSLRWPLWAFPKEHPIRATVAYTLGQANSNQLELMVGGPLSNPLGYAFPVYNTGSVAQDEYRELRKEGIPAKRAKAIASHSVMPVGSRISPGQSNVTQAIQSGNVSNVLSSLNPALGAAITATTGHEPFTDRQVKERGYAALEGLIELPKPATLRVFGGRNLSEIAMGAIGADAERSPTSKAFARYDKNRELRSFALPAIPQSAQKFVAGERFAEDEATAHGEGKIPYYGDTELFQKIMYGHNGGPNPNPHARKRELREAIKKINEAEYAGERNTMRTAPFYPPGKDIPKKVEDEIREAFETAWEYGPSGKKRRARRKRGGGIGGPAGGGIGGYTLGGDSIGGSVGGSIGGGIGGHPVP
jgi:hypothetical protein